MIYPSKPYNHDVSSYTYLFSRYPFELHVTTRLPPTLDLDLAHEQVIHQVIKPLAHHLKQKLAALTVIVPATFIDGTHKPAHAHSLVLSFVQDLLQKKFQIQAYGLAPKENGFFLWRTEDAIQIKIFGDSDSYPDGQPGLIRKMVMGYVAKNLAENEGATLHTYKNTLLKRSVNNGN